MALEQYAGIFGTILVLAVFVAVFAGLWKAFQKAGLEGWKAIIPVYNVYLVIKLADLSGWFLLGFFIPFISAIVTFYVYYKFAKNYGQDTLLAVVTGIFPFAGVPIIGFGDARYEGNYAP